MDMLLIFLQGNRFHVLQRQYSVPFTAAFGKVGVGGWGNLGSLDLTLTCHDLYGCLG